MSLRLPAQRVNADETVQQNFEKLSLQFPVQPRNIAPAPRCVVPNSAGVTVAAGAVAYMSFDTHVDVTAGMHSVSTNPDRVTFVTPGLYVVTVSIGLSAPVAGGRLQIGLERGGAVMQSITSVPVGGYEDTLCAVRSYAAGDYIRVRVSNQTGAAVTFVVAEYGQELAVARVGS